MKILVVDDEEKLLEPIRVRLEKEGYTVDTATDGLDGAYQAQTGVYDLVILDVMLPYKDGFTILRELRQNGTKTPIIMLTAKTAIEDKLAGFENGADDYIPKPFHLEELVARVNTKLKKDVKENIIEYGDVRLDLGKKILVCGSEEIELMRKEFLLMECLMEHQDQVSSKDFLHDKVWGMDEISSSNNLEAYISFIRKKLETLSSQVTIKAVRGLGYKLKVKNA